jgi:capsular polysaccharide export protein
LEEVCLSRGVRILVLFGDARSHHAAARQVAERLAIPVVCLEEGYVRPGYVTCEIGGNNARSPLAQPGPQPPPGEPAPPCNESGAFAAMAFHATLGHIAARVGERLGAGRAHRRRPLAREGLRWLRCLALKALLAGTERRALARMARGAPVPRYLLALQIEDDAQLLENGRGYNTKTTIDSVIASFARAAPSESLLLVKVHPLDRGHRPHARMVRHAARRHRVVDRIVLLQTGPLAPVLHVCDTMVTVNSTSGLSALYRGRPVACLGEAFYVGPGLAVSVSLPDELDRFWRCPAPVDLDAVAGLKARMMAESLVPGSFYAPGARRATAHRIAERIKSSQALREAASSCLIPVFDGTVFDNVHPVWAGFSSSPWTMFAFKSVIIRGFRSSFRWLSR